MSVLIGFLILCIVISLIKKGESTKTQVAKGYPEGVKYVKRADLSYNDIQQMQLDVLNEDCKEVIELSANSIQELKYLISKFEEIELKDVELLSNGETYLQGQKIKEMWRYSPFGTFEWYRPAISQEEYERRYFSIMYPGYTYTQHTTNIEPNEDIEEEPKSNKGKIIQGPW